MLFFCVNVLYNSTISCKKISRHIDVILTTFTTCSSEDSGKHMKLK